MRIRIILFLLVLLYGAHPGLAQDGLINFDVLPNGIGAILGVAPDYLGSDDYRFAVLPFGRLSFAEHRFVALTGTFVYANILNHPHLRLGPMVNLRLGRSDVDDDAVDRMADIDTTLEFGLDTGLEFIDPRDPRKRIGVSTNFVHDVLGEHDGYQVSMNVRGWYPVARFLTLGLATGFSYGSDNYMSTYFGVTQADATRSGLPAFDADNGIRDAKVITVALLHLSKSWHIGAGLYYLRLLSDAADSPVVDLRGSENQIFAGAGVMYVWGFSRGR
jgi:outer membrane protein